MNASPRGAAIGSYVPPKLHGCDEAMAKLVSWT